ncbi:adenylosuccinate synthetase [Dyella sp. 2HG41-7]|uniref:adenylosuccinate synthetase n=1 Tax=Dyella sp. 2HG41-7 TaxID=2883239 RepID=UPI001F1E3840|nr:adenylosuccinate synthetase [Dyella sp. 2HG41-7]
MSNRQIVIISGKTCSGKTGLAKLLRSQYQFKIIATREILRDHLGKAGDTANREELIAEGIKLDRDTNSKWVAEGVAERIKNLPEEQGVVVDHVSSPDQIEAFRTQFGPNLVHVHLYASTDTLHKRYSNSEGQRKDAPVYEEIDHLTNQAHILKLLNDADVRINTDRTDDRDTLVRVAARLHLFSSPEVRCVDVLVGGQYGSEGKGNIVAYLAREYDVLVRVGGPNAGHTVVSAKGKFIHHLLPSGSGFTAGKLLLGPGMTINVKGLLEEINGLGIGSDRLFIDPQASIIEQDDIDTEQQGVVGAIASTGSGSGSAKARRITHRGNKKTQVLLAQDVPELGPFIASTADQLELAYRNGKSILLEGTQGSLLSLYHGRYPYVTSRDTNVAGCLAEAGISPSRVRKILMVVRTTPIRVANPDGDEGNISGFLKHETSFEIIAKRAGLDPKEVEGAEITSTTKRKRRVGWFEWEQFRRACDLNAPTDIVLTFVDYLSKDNQNARRFEQLDLNTIKFIEELERVAQAPVSLINTRFPKKDDDFRDLRSIIDRRNWNGRSDIR